MIAQNTLLFNTQTGKTKPMRSKEEAHDYRYFPDPDLLPLELENVFIEKIMNEIPELPDKRKERYINNLQLSNYDASILTTEKEVSDYFDLVLETHKELKVSAKLVANWITSELFSLLKKNDISITNNPIKADFLGQLVLLITTDKISGKIAKDIFEEMFNDKKSPNEIIEKKGLIQVSDTKEIEVIINEILNKNKDKVSDYKIR